MSGHPVIERGMIGFPLAPFHENLELNLSALERDVAMLASHPFRAINAPAGISEVFSLTVEESVDIVRTTVNAVAGRMPVIGCVCSSLPQAQAMARQMEKAGADALLVLPPYYPNAPFEGLLDYYRGIGSASGLPLVIYSRGWANFSPEEVERLAGEVPSLRYWKDGQGDMRAYQRIMSRVGNRLTWIGGVGDDAAAGYAAIGIEVLTSSISPVAPRLCFAWGEAALDGDCPRLNEILVKYVHPLFALRSRKRGYEVAAMKKLSEMLGRPVGPVRPPLPGLGDREIAELREIAESWQPFL